MEPAQDIENSEARIADVIAVVRDTVRRRWLVLAIVTVVVFALGAALITQLPARYTSTTRIRIDPSRNPLATKSADGRMELTPEALETEVTAIRSTRLAQTVVRNLGLVDDPEYADGLKEQKGATLSSKDARELAVANAVLRNLSVDREKLTYLIEVSFTSSNGVKSARIANAFAIGYIEAKVASKSGTAENQAEWFKYRLADLAEEARDADAKVAQFRAQNGIVESANSESSVGTILDQQIAPLAEALAMAESEAAGARASMNAARGQIGRGGMENVSAVLNSEVVSNFRSQRADVLRNMAEIDARYGPLHPESIRVHDQLKRIDTQIGAEARRVVGSLGASAVASAARAESLQRTLRDLETRRSKDAGNSVIAQSLEREAAAKRTLYDRMAQMSLDSMQTARVSMAQAEIVDKAQAPLSPTSPNRPLLFVVAGIFALAAGLGTIAVQEVMTGGVRSIEEIERQYGLPVLAAVPNVPRNTNPADLLLDQPTSFFAEALRIARASVMGVKSQSSPQIVAITSALPSEGKTTTALSFARTLAIAKSRTLLIECDVRRALIHRMVRSEVPKAGLVEVLHGEAAVEDAIAPGDVPGLDHLLTTSKYFSSEDLFGEGAMETLLNRLRSRYDHIVLDLPPLMGLADGRFLAIQAAATILVVRWSATPKSAVSAALNFLRMDGSKPVGIILTMVDSSAQSMGGLNYYSNKYAAYYQSS